MTYDELRRLAIRLSVHTDLQDQQSCGECGGEPKHAPDCPIAELEAEEVAATTKPAGEYEGEF